VRNEKRSVFRVSCFVLRDYERYQTGIRASGGFAATARPLVLFAIAWVETYKNTVAALPERLQEFDGSWNQFWVVIRISFRRCGQ
jgi:hypothetical protein